MFIWPFVYIYVCLCVCLGAQLCPTLCNSMDCSPPDSSVHWILQAKILEWVAIPFSKESSQPRDRTYISCTVSRFFTISAPRKTTHRKQSSKIWAALWVHYQLRLNKVPWFSLHTVKKYTFLILFSAVLFVFLQFSLVISLFKMPP